MAYAEKRGNYWRARWRGPDGTLQSSPATLRFKTKKDAQNYGRDQETAIRNGSYVDPKAGNISLEEWVNLWFPSLDLELSTLGNYRYLIEVHLLPAFGKREIRSLTPEEIATWEKGIAARHGYSKRTAKDARSMLTIVLSAAVPQHITANPAIRPKGRGRRGQRRIEKIEDKKKVWVTPLQALLVAERCSALSGRDSDFVKMITMAYTGARWGEVVGLAPGKVRGDEIDLHWKLYELNGRFYRGWPKDGSARTVDIPPFLAELLRDHIAEIGDQRCTCRAAEEPWCPGDRYLFLGPEGGHDRRSNFSERLMRPSADGWHPRRKGKDARPPMPVLVDADEPWPGRPLPPWPAAEPGRDFAIPTGKGRPRLINDADNGRCAHCKRTHRRRVNGLLIAHSSSTGPCPGSGKPPAGDAALANWLPIARGLTPHGLRHSHQTWLEDAHVHYFLIAERMGHEIPGMRGTYGHVTPAMRQAATEFLQRLWDASLRERSRISPRSIVPALDALLRQAASRPS